MPDDATEIVISCGGNDALGHLGVLQAPCPNLHAALGILAPLLQAFREDYCAMLRCAKSSERPVTVCTVYDAVPGLDAPTRLALSLFNDVIQREAGRHDANVLDLRMVMIESVDFAVISPIEPSAIGSRKIAFALERIIVARRRSP